MGFDRARAALRATNGHIGKAILRLKGKLSGKESCVLDDSKLLSSTIVCVEVNSVNRFHGLDLLSWFSCGTNMNG
jgi:hypothetical protein